MIDMVLFSILHQAPGLSPDQTFVLELAKLFVQVVLGLFTLLGVYVNIRATRAVGLKADRNASQVKELADKHAELTENVNGKMTRLLEVSERAAHAEGVVEGVKTATPPVVLPVVVPTPPPGPSVPGGRRANDRPPPENDPSTHFP